MLILALDTSTRQCSMALLRDGEVLASTGGVTEEPYAARVFADLSGLLARAGVQLAQIELFAVAAGPGSFTGLRVGLTAVKGWAEVLGRPVATVSALEAVAVQAQRPEGLLAAVVDARGGQMFGGMFRRETGSERLKALAEEVVLPPEEYVRWVAEVAGAERPVFVTTTPEVLRASLAGSGFDGAVVEVVPGELAPLIGRLGLARSLQGQTVDALSLEANYVRRPDAEVKRQGG